MTAGRRMEQDIAEILLDEATIQARVAELGAQLTQDYQGKEVIMICILKGAVVFYADLVRAMDVHMKMDFMGISSYETRRRLPASCALQKISTRASPGNMSSLRRTSWTAG